MATAEDDAWTVVVESAATAAAGEAKATTAVRAAKGTRFRAA
jgi:hypothetical protein